MGTIKIYCAPHYKGDPPSIKSGDAGIDLRSAYPVRMFSKEDGQISVPTGIHVEIPSGMCGLIWGRSGKAKDTGLHIHAGVIDETYRGEIQCIVSAIHPMSLEEGERFAQMVVVPYFNVIEIVRDLNDLSETGRGEKGFGASGKQ